LEVLRLGIVDADLKNAVASTATETDDFKLKAKLPRAQQKYAESLTIAPGSRRKPQGSYNNGDRHLRETLRVLLVLPNAKPSSD
jgi:hypothetical protein